MTDDTRKMLIDQAWRDAEDAFERGHANDSRKKALGDGPVLARLPSFARERRDESLGESAVERFNARYARGKS